MNEHEFLAFLSSVDKHEASSGGRYGFVSILLEQNSFLFVLLGIVLGGLALNLTPCVLPIIPVNISIIGAGARSASRSRGFFLGSLYGAGIALSYGVLGVVVVLSGSMFGAINASPWFNLGVAFLFMILALSMFDVFAIDFSRLMRGAGSAGAARGAFAVFFMGVISALLAGACVAPVVIFVLIHSAGLYAQGREAGLVLPFLLGIGMALPWPFIGAGITVLPKPGKWMKGIKIMFGVMIFAMSVYYAMMGTKLLLERIGPIMDESEFIKTDTEDWVFSIAEGLAKSRENDMPVLIDFWAGWCKSCLVMRETTLRHPDVKAKMREFVAVKYRADRPTRSPHKEHLAAFDVVGFPTYVIVMPDGLSRKYH